MASECFLELVVPLAEVEDQLVEVACLAMEEGVRVVAVGSLQGFEWATLNLIYSLQPMLIGWKT